MKNRSKRILKVVALILVFSLLFCVTAAFAYPSDRITYVEYNHTFIIGESFTISGMPLTASMPNGYWVSGPSQSVKPENSAAFTNLKYVFTRQSPSIENNFYGVISVSGKAVEPGSVTINYTYTVCSDPNYSAEYKVPRIILNAISDQYTVRLNANGGICGENEHAVVYGKEYSYKGSLPLPERDGYNFDGWYTSSSGGDRITDSTKFTDKSSMLSNSTITLYAHWTKKTIYYVSYYANGGSGAPSRQSKTEGVDLILSDDVPSRTGYAFEGWATSSSASEARYQPGDRFSVDANTSLYAVWKAVYTVSYNANGGSGAPASQTKTKGVALILSSIVPTRNGYEFQGWATSSSSNKVSYRPGDSFTKDANTNLYAVWKSNTPSITTYSISYNANGGTGAPSNQTKEKGKTVILSEVIPSRTGYEFQGWATSSASTTISYMPGARYAEDADITLYAVWMKTATPTTYTISYSANGGSGAPSNQTKTKDVALTLSRDIPTRTGYQFQGWATSSSSMTVAYKPGTPYTENVSITLYAVWKKTSSTSTTITVSYSANGGHGAPSRQTKEKGEVLTLSSTVPARSQYTFLGWATSPSTTAVSYQPGGTFALDADTTLYAVWRKDEIMTYTITYDANGGNGGSSSYMCVKGDRFLIGKIPTRTGYVFQGWGKTPSSEYVYRPGEGININSDITLYAIWKPDTDENTSYSIYYFDNYVFGYNHAQTKPKGIEVTLWGLGWNIDGYSFQGWATSPTATIPLYQDGDTYNVDADISLYAVWKLNDNNDTITQIPEDYYNSHSISSVRSNAYGKDYDFSMFKALQKLDCSNRNMTNLNISQNNALTELDCANNLLSSLDLSKNKSLKYLSCVKNLLTNLDLSRNTALEELYCWDNELTYLNVRNITALRKLTCSNNQLTSLDLSDNIELRELRCSNNLLTSLDLRQNTKLNYFNCTNCGRRVPVVNSQFDLSTLPGFDVSRAYDWENGEVNGNILTFYGTRVTYQYDCGNNKSASFYLEPEGESFCISYTGNGNDVGYEGGNSYWRSIDDFVQNVPSDQIKAAGYPLILSDKVPTKYGKTFIGWGDFSSGNMVIYQPGDSFNVDADTLLFALWASKEDNSEDKHLIVGRKELTSLDVSCYVDLELLDCSYNNLTSLDVSHNTALRSLHCGVNKLTDLDVSHNIALKSLECNINDLTNLDISQNTALEYLGFNGNDLTNIDVSHNTALKELYCSSNLLTNLDISQNAVLERLNCRYNQLTSLDLSHNTALEILNCGYNKLTSLDLSHNIALETLYCYNNQLTSLDLSHNTALKALYCSSNQLTSLDLSQNTALSSFGCNSCGRDVTVIDGAFDLSTLPDLDVSRASNWQNGTVNGSILTFDKARVTYTYDCGNGFTAEFYLQAVEKDDSWFTVAYDANGGSGAPASQTKTKGEVLALSSEIPARTGYEFQGWATSSTATTAEYQAGARYTQDEDVTLYAVWIEETASEKILVLPENLSHIEHEAFVGIAAEYIEIPASVEFIAADAFDPDTKLIVVENSLADMWAKEHGFTVLYRE